MLMTYKWNDANLRRDFINDPELVKNTLNLKSYSKEPMKKYGEFTCPVCYDDSRYRVWMKCGHLICLFCYHVYMESRIALGPESAYSPCPEVGCKMFVPEEIVADCLRGYRHLKFKKFYRRAFMESSQMMQTCPNTWCDKAF